MATHAIIERATEPLVARPAEPAHRAIDLVHLSRQTLGDRDLEIELLGLFRRQAAQVIEQIALATDRGDRRHRRDLGHTLKGSARAIGAGAVAAAAQTYEDAICAGTPEPGLVPLRAALAGAVAEVDGVVANLLGER